METIRTWIVSDKDGRNIFYFELFTVGNENTLCFDSNISFQPQHKLIADYLELLLSTHLPNSTKDSIAPQLFNLIKKIKYYQKFFIPENVLDKNGRLNMSSYKLIQELTFVKLKQECEYNVPISNYSYPDLFRVFENYFCIHKHDIMKNSNIISKIKFESKLINEDLKHQYVNIYNQTNTYFLHKAEHGYYTYFILSKNKLLLFAFKTL